MRQSRYILASSPDAATLPPPRTTRIISASPLRGVAEMNQDAFGPCTIEGLIGRVEFHRIAFAKLTRQAGPLFVFRLATRWSRTLGSVLI